MTYPKFVIDSKKLKANAEHVLKMCGQNNIEVVGVVKSVNGLDGVVKILIEAGFKTLASSRLSQLRKIKEINSDILTYDLRIPMLSEVNEVVAYADISLNSSLEVLKELNRSAKQQNKIHKVIIMCEQGDLREGIYDEEELTNVSTRFIMGEFVREKILELTRDEIPHEVTCLVENYNEEEDIVHIQVLIVVDRENIKKIIIGKNGKLLKEIGMEARKDIEELLGEKIYLGLWVKVKDEWRKKKPFLKEMGYVEEK